MTQRQSQRAASRPGEKTDFFETKPICHPTGCFSFTATQVPMTLRKARGRPESSPSLGWMGHLQENTRCEQRAELGGHSATLRRKPVAQHCVSSLGVVFLTSEMFWEPLNRLSSGRSSVDIILVCWFFTGHELTEDLNFYRVHVCRPRHPCWEGCPGVGASRHGVFMIFMCLNVPQGPPAGATP